MFSIIFQLFCLKFAHCEAFLKNKQHRRIIVVLLTATLAAGCGGSDDDESDGDATEDGVTSTSLLLNDDQILIELRALVEENNLEPLPAAPTVSVELYELG